ncbi:MAG: cobalamin-dependent protein [Deltaproteobacteria bacterium]|nr:cobalamin-dependent protein [Deltaproteobacteria bacterium]
MSSSLRKNGFDVDEIFFQYFTHHAYKPPTEEQIRTLIDLLREREIGLVGLSLRIGALFNVATQLTQRIKKELGIPVMWGGAHVTMAPEDCVEKADFIALGESEKTILDIARAHASDGNVETIQNVWMRVGDKLVKNPLRPLTPDLDTIPSPDFHSVANKFWVRGETVVPGEPLAGEKLFRIMATRGCVYRCGFCGISAMRRVYEGNGTFYRVRSVESCVSEIERARPYFPNLKRIRFDDELFVVTPDWLEEFSDVYPRRVGLPFDVLSNPNCLDETTIRKLAESGMDEIFVGVQGASKHNRKLYHRTGGDDRILEVAKNLKRFGVHGMFQILIDDPGAEREDKEQLLNVLLRFPRPFDLLIYSLCHWPGTDRTRELLEAGLITPDDVEGRNAKVLHQFNADFTYPRPPEENFFLALYLLCNKRGVPRPLIRWLTRSRFLAKHPSPVIAAAKLVNTAKFVVKGIGLILKGEASILTARRWLEGQRIATLPAV